MFVDTCFCVDLMRETLRGESGPAIGKLRRLGGVRLQMPLFVLCELQAGARMASNARRELRRVERFAEQFDLVCPDVTFAVGYGVNEASLRQAGHPIPTMDLLVGTLAQLYGMPLITRDSEHYRRLPGLVVESY